MKMGVVEKLKKTADTIMVAGEEGLTQLIQEYTHPDQKPSVMVSLKECRISEVLKTIALESPMSLKTTVVTPRTNEATPSGERGEATSTYTQRKRRIYDIMYGKPLDRVPPHVVT